jgi:YggT family protein
MLIIERIFWFVQAAISVVIVAVIVLMIVRLIVDAMDLNPFAWTSRTIRRLTDGVVMPVRGGLRGFGMDPRFAPLVVILVVILLGYFILQLVGTIAGTLVGVLVSAQRGAIITVLGFLLYGLLSIYLLLITIRIVFSWGMVSYTNRVMKFLVDVTEPLLGPLRRMIPPLGWLDISPLVAILIIWLFQAAVAGTLLRGATGSFQAF